MSLGQSQGFSLAASLLEINAINMFDPLTVTIRYWCFLALSWPTPFGALVFRSQSMFGGKSRNIISEQLWRMDSKHFIFNRTCPLVNLTSWWKINWKSQFSIVFLPGISWILLGPAQECVGQWQLALELLKEMNFQQIRADQAGSTGHQRSKVVGRWENPELNGALLGILLNTVIYIYNVGRGRERDYTYICIRWIFQQLACFKIETRIWKILKKHVGVVSNVGILTYFSHPVKCLQTIRELWHAVAETVSSCSTPTSMMKIANHWL